MSLVLNNPSPDVFPINVTRLANKSDQSMQPFDLLCLDQQSSKIYTANSKSMKADF